MIVFTDKEDRIIAYDSTDKKYKNKLDVGGFFDNKCDEFIYGYKAEPTYEYEIGDDFLPILDDKGNPVYKKDKDGNPVVSGISVYPFKPYLEIYQSAYETMILTVADTLGGAYE